MAVNCLLGRSQQGLSSLEHISRLFLQRTNHPLSQGWITPRKWLLLTGGVLIRLNKPANAWWQETDSIAQLASTLRPSSDKFHVPVPQVTQCGSPFHFKQSYMPKNLTWCYPAWHDLICCCVLAYLQAGWHASRGQNNTVAFISKVNAYSWQRTLELLPTVSWVPWENIWTVLVINSSP